MYSSQVSKSPYVSFDDIINQFHLQNVLAFYFSCETNIVKVTFTSQKVLFYS